MFVLVHPDLDELILIDGLQLDVSVSVPFGATEKSHVVLNVVDVVFFGHIYLIVSILLHYVELLVVKLGNIEGLTLVEASNLARKGFDETCQLSRAQLNIVLVVYFYKVTNKDLTLVIRESSLLDVFDELLPLTSTDLLK